MSRGNDRYSILYQDTLDNIRKLSQDYTTIKGYIEHGAKSSKSKAELEDKIDESNELIKDTKGLLKQLNTLVNSRSNEDREKIKKIGEDFDKFTVIFQELSSTAMSKTHVPLDKGVYTDTPYTDDQDDDDERFIPNRDVQLQDDVEMSDSIIYEREQEIKHIAGQMVEVNEIFKDLARIVEDQSLMVDHIQSNISSANANVKAGTSELQDASKYQSSSRKKLCFLAIFLTVVVAVIIVVLVVTLGVPNH
eukprot:TRINITY_DN2229_c0_g1_i1.p1 TRINITY_DN2229_c0_g1~~TRINITY_DN2229_c0_g1_i1.p1  ORF type:complete len:249 (-),score=51.02 TRINITY_DN2229_c0_g1_i1:35-781(-)